MNSPAPSPDSTDSTSPASEGETPKSLAGIKPKFSLGPIVIALIAITCIWRVYIVLQGLKLDQDMLWVSTVSGRSVGTIIGVILISVGPAWLVWRIARRRKAFAIATCIIMLGLINLRTANLLDRQANEEALEQISSVMAVQSDQQKDLLDRSIAGEDVSAEMKDLVGQSLRKVEKIGEKSNGSQAQVFAVISNVMRRIEGPLNTYVTALNHFEDAGGIDPATMTDRATIPERLRLVDEYAAANEQLAEAHDSLEPELRKQLGKLTVDKNFVGGKDFINGFVEGWREGAQPGLVSQIRQSDRELIVSFRSLINILDTAHGRWSIDGNMLVFDDDAILNQYNEHFNRMNEAAARQENLRLQYQQAINNLEPSP